MAAFGRLHSVNLLFYVRIVGAYLPFVVLPALIYFAGSALLGPFEGASLGTSFRSIYQGLGDGSIAAWIVVERAGEHGATPINTPTPVPIETVRHF